MFTLLLIVAPVLFACSMVAIAFGELVVRPSIERAGRGVRKAMGL